MALTEHFGNNFAAPHDLDTVSKKKKDWVDNTTGDKVAARNINTSIR
jgi:hypothetical protein